MPQENNCSPMPATLPSVQFEQGGSKTQVMPIAVIGMAFRGPGDATSPQRLWEMCCEGRNAWTEFPKDKIKAEGFWHPDPARPGCVRFRTGVDGKQADCCQLNSKGGHFSKEDVRLFDAPFFGVSPNEARVRLCWIFGFEYDDRKKDSDQYSRRWIRSTDCCWNHHMKHLKMVSMQR